MLKKNEQTSNIILPILDIMYFSKIKRKKI